MFQLNHMSDSEDSLKYKQATVNNKLPLLLLSKASLCFYFSNCIVLHMDGTQVLVISKV